MNVIKKIRPNWCRVPEPCVIDTKWNAGMVFTEEDDVDRTDIGWSLSQSFLANQSPIKDLIEVEDLLPTGESSNTKFAMILHNVLTENECNLILQSANEKQYTKALINISRGMQMYSPKHRKGLRCIVDCDFLSELLFIRTHKYIPKIPNMQLRNINERLRILCYSNGEDTFPAHCDGQYTRYLNHPYAGDQSQITLQLYLNTIPLVSDGGGTSLNQYHRIIQPKVGSVLIFTQPNILHEGLPLLTNGIKYTLRSEYMFSSVL